MAERSGVFGVNGGRMSHEKQEKRMMEIAEKA
jgi:hypothetical protein